MTELKFDTASATPKIIFRAVRPLSEDEMDVVIEKGKSPDAVQAITFNPAQTDRVTTAKAAPAPKEEEEAPAVFRDAPAPKKAAKETAPVEETEEPVVRAKAPKAEPAKDLADVLSAWGDDED